MSIESDANAVDDSEESRPSSAASAAPYGGESDHVDELEGLDAADDDVDAPRPIDRVFEHWIFGDDPLWGLLGVALTGFFVLWYFFHFAHLTSDIHRGYGDSAFDIGLYDQGVWLLSRFHAPFITMMGRNLFGDHTQFQMVLMVPLYWIRPDATTLLIAQAGLMAAGAIPCTCWRCAA